MRPGLLAGCRGQQQAAGQPAHAPGDARLCFTHVPVNFMLVCCSFSSADEINDDTQEEDCPMHCPLMLDGRCMIAWQATNNLA